MWKDCTSCCPTRYWQDCVSARRVGGVVSGVVGTTRKSGITSRATHLPDCPRSAKPCLRMWLPHTTATRSESYGEIISCYPVIKALTNYRSPRTGGARCAPDTQNDDRNGTFRNGDRHPSRCHHRRIFHHRPRHGCGHRRFGTASSATMWNSIKVSLWVPKVSSRCRRQSHQRASHVIRYWRQCHRVCQHHRAGTCMHQ